MPRRPLPPAGDPLLQPPPGPTLEELARLLAPHSPMARGSAAPTATPLPVPSTPPASEEGQPPSVDGLEFESVEALADLPEEAQAELAASGQLLTLAPDPMVKKWCSHTMYDRMVMHTVA